MSTATPQSPQSSANPSNQTSQRSVLGLRKLSPKIPLVISSKLQDQIYYLCSKVPNLEWSGVLFYNTEGTFGEKGFRVICEEVFPLDIGSSGYTEYETDDPDFIKFLMANTKLLEMKKGHIHSHNRMTTFFSGTDMSELHDNAPNHNIYVSLIVNNANDNCAKIAFVVTETIEIPEITAPAYINSRTVTYRNEVGEMITKTYTDEVPTKVTAASKAENKFLYVYDCEIEYPGTVGGTLTARFQQLSENLRKREEERQKNAAKNTTKYPEYSPFQQIPGGKRDWNQPELFDSHRQTNKQTAKNQGNKGVLFLPQGKSGKDLLKEIEKSDRKREKGGNSTYSQLPKNTKTELYSLLGKLLTLDPMSEEHPARTMNVVNQRFYPAGKRSQEMKTQANMYYDAITERASSFYSMSFGEDKKKVNYQSTMLSIIDILSTFDSHFPELVDNLTEAIQQSFTNNKQEKLFS